MKRDNGSDESNIVVNQDNIKDEKNDIRIDENDITVIIKTGNKNKTPVLITVLPVFAMLLSLLPGIMHKSWCLETARFGIIALLLSGIVVFYIRFNLSGLYDKKLFKTIIIFNYLGSLALLLFVPEPEIFSFWMLGGLIIAMLVDQKLGLLVHFVFSIFMGACFIQSPEAIIQVMFMGVLMIMLSGALKQKTTVIYAAVIILSTDITLAFALNNFIFQSVNNFNYLYSLFSILIIIISAFSLSSIYSMKYYGNIAVKTLENGTEPNDTKATINQQAAEVTYIAEKGLETPTIQLTAQEITTEHTGSVHQLESDELDNASSYDLLSDHNNALLVNLKQYSEVLYTHAERIADLSYRAAYEIGADAKLALAGGLYHEIGKIKGGANYIDDGLTIADEYSFPKELKAIIREHNIKYGKPGSIEAAIVMLSDSVEATISYIVKSKGNKYTTDKIIDNIFQMRMDKGTFDSCPLQIKEFKKLRDFFIKEYADTHI
jgi:putative nucleotidyltransferase with HDIG domain